MAYTHVLFDADDTLFDFCGACRQALKQTAERLAGGQPEGAYEVYITNNRKWWSAFERGEVTMEQLSRGRFSDFLDAMKLSGCGTPEQWREEYQSNLSRCPLLVEGAEELCLRLQGRCRMFIVTNGISEVQRGRMSRASIRHCFEDMFISQEMGCRKPQPDYFRMVLERLGGVDKSRVLVVGDSLTSDVKGALAAGLDVCWYNPSGADPGELTPTYTVRRLEDIETIVAGGR